MHQQIFWVATTSTNSANCPITLNLLSFWIIFHWLHHLHLLKLNLFLVGQINFVGHKIGVFFLPKSGHQSQQRLRLFLVQKAGGINYEQRHHEWWLLSGEECFVWAEFQIFSYSCCRCRYLAYLLLHEREFPDMHDGTVIQLITKFNL